VGARLGAVLVELVVGAAGRRGLQLRLDLGQQRALALVDLVQVAQDLGLLPVMRW